MFKMSSAAAQKTSTKSFQIFSAFAVFDRTQPTKNWKISTQPMDNSAENPERMIRPMTAHPE